MKQSKWLTFTLVAIAQFMVVLDTAITNVALPTIKQQLHFTNSSLQWVITAYALTFGGFLLLGGRAADLFGRRRTLLSGMIAFTTFSLLIAVAHKLMLSRRLVAFVYSTDCIARFAGHVCRLNVARSLVYCADNLW